MQLTIGSIVRGLSTILATRDTHCANDLAPWMSAFALIFPKTSILFYVPNPCTLYAGNKTSLTM